MSYWMGAIPGYVPEPVVKPSEQVILGALGVGLNHSERQAYAEILGVASRFHEEGTHKGATAGAMDGLCERFESAGFTLLERAEEQSDFISGLGMFVLKTSSKWLHPDCDVPFLVSMVVKVHCALEKRGLVTLVLGLRDAAPSTTGPGVLATRPFVEAYVVQAKGNLPTAQRWENWVVFGLRQVRPRMLKALFDRATAYLEASTTP